MRILVTGSSGFIGRHVVAALVQDGHELVLVDHAPSFLGTRGAAWVPYDLCKDLRDLSAYDLPRVEAVVHLAAKGGVSFASRHPKDTVDANVLGTMSLLEAAKGARHFIHASSFSVYGASYRYTCATGHALTVGQTTRRVEDLDAGRYEIMCHDYPALIEPCDESTPPAPLETYGASKLMQELCYRSISGITPVSILRFSSVYGQHLPAGGEATIIAKIAASIREGKSPEIFEDGLQIRDWVHVQDVVDAIRACLRDPADRLVNVCSGEPVTLSGACSMIAHVMARPGVGPRIVGGYRAGDMRHCLGDSARLQGLIGRPPTTFADGVREAFGVPG